MGEEKLRDAVLLVYANKQDMAGAASVEEVAESLELGEVRIPWFIQACSATSGAVGAHS
jgi:signal recognition particle receptor subunit beta